VRVGGEGAHAVDDERRRSRDRLRSGEGDQRRPSSAAQPVAAGDRAVQRDADEQDTKSHSERSAAARSCVARASVRLTVKTRMQAAAGRGMLRDEMRARGAAVAATLALVAGAAAPASAATIFTLTGHGFGHGVGISGAFAAGATSPAAWSACASRRPARRFASTSAPAGASGVRTGTAPFASCAAARGSRASTSSR
jgi:hypothetical protein